MYCNAALARMNPFSVSRRHTQVPFSKFVVYQHMISGFEQPVEHVFRGLHYHIRCVWAKHKDAIDGRVRSGRLAVGILVCTQSCLIMTRLGVHCLP